MPQNFITIRVCLMKPNSGDAQYTLSTNDQGKSFGELVYGSVNQVLADHRPAVLYDVVHFRLLCKEYLTLV